jgi:hypothetical protein
MSSAPRDNNRVPTMIAALNTDGVTPVFVNIDPSIHSINVNDGTTGTDYGTLPDKRDDNRIPFMMGVSSADGETLVPIYADSNGSLLINSM